MEPQINREGEKLEVYSFDADRKEEWNQLVFRSPHFSIMQSYEWGEFKKSQGWDSVRLGIMAGNELIAGAQVLFLPILNGLYCLAYVPRGPLCQPDNLSILEILDQGIKSSAKQRRAIYIKVEPQWENSTHNCQIFTRFGYRESKHTNQPRASLILDLSLDDEILLAQMNQSTRRNIRYAKRNGIIVSEGSKEDLTRFYDLLKKTGIRKKFPIRDYTYYEKEFEKFSSKGEVNLLFATYQGKTLATGMVFTCGQHAAQFHSAISGELTQLRANHLLVWEAIKRAKSKGCLSYDMWGIPDEVGEMHYTGNQHEVHGEGDLWGVYQFKRGFGGKVVFYVGAYDYVFSNFIYSISVDGILRNLSLDQIIDRFL
jgi:lipid II:glycine glycyltransferase (peptidoglycan interpeptide bridge formation enzyme)